MLLTCEWTRVVWFGLGIGYRINRDKISSLDRWVEEIVKDTCKENKMKFLSLIAVTC